MKNWIWFAFFIVMQHAFAKSDVRPDKLIVRSGLNRNQISEDWKSALRSRMTTSELDSVSAIVRPLTKEEMQWMKLIESKAALWNSFKDSLEVPFNKIHVSDTVYVLLGYLGVDDAFTWKYNTVCLDLTALQNNYGSADDLVNNKRIDRLFAHEFTHLIHKEWARKNKLELKSFRDSVLWECLYEGIGMYRSLSEKWWINNGVIRETTEQTLTELQLVFAEHITALQSKTTFTRTEREQIQKNLSRGPVNKKWGATTVAIWLMKEAKGEDRNLIPWLNAGPETVIKLALKHLKK